MAPLTSISIDLQMFGGLSDIEITLWTMSDLISSPPVKINDMNTRFHECLSPISRLWALWCLENADSVWGFKDLQSNLKSQRKVIAQNRAPRLFKAVVLVCK